MAMRLYQLLQEAVSDEERRYVEHYFRDRVEEDHRIEYYIPTRYNTKVSYGLLKAVVVPHTDTLEVLLHCYVYSASQNSNENDDLYYDHWDLNLDDRFDKQDIIDAIRGAVYNDLYDYYGIRDIVINVDIKN